MTYFTKSDIVTAALREMVVTGELAPGTELRQRDLAAQFNVSPTPVREALRRLESEGLINYHIHRGARVVDTAFGANEENFLIRAVLEGLAAALAAIRVTDEVIEELTALNAELATCDGPGARAFDVNRRFHFRIYEAARSPSLLALLRMVWQSFPPGSDTVRPLSESVRQHGEIIQLLASHDPAGAEAAIHAHITEAHPDSILPDLRRVTAAAEQVG